MRARVGLSARAQKDWARLNAATHLRIVRALEGLGAAPWQRLRVGDFRVIFRSLTRAEIIGFPEDRGYLIERVVPRGDLDRAIKGLR